MPEAPTIKPLAKIGTRKFWKGDSAISYVTSLPKEWVEEYIGKHLEKEERVINLSQIGRTLLITPTKNLEEKTKRLELRINGENTDQIYYSVISAYLQNYDDVCLKEQDKNLDLRKKFNEIDQKLPGAEFKKEGADYLITFERRIENIPKKIDEIYNHYAELYSQNQKMFEGKIKNPDIEIEYDIVKKKENLVDNKVYALKRLFAHVFETLFHSPEILFDTGLLRHGEEIDYTAAYKIAGYRSVATSLERVTDIQKDIFELLRQPPSKATSHGGGYSFAKYYEGSHRMMEDAYQSKKVTENLSDSNQGFQCLLRVLAAEDNLRENLRYREGYISFEERKKIRALVEKSPTLCSLEGLIWGTTGLATNIAETWLNMSDLPRVNGYVYGTSKKRK